MTDQRSHHPPDELDPGSMADAYIDGVLSTDARREFQMKLKTDQKLRAEIDRRQKIDVAVKRLYAPPSADRVLQALAQHTSTDVGREAKSPVPGEEKDHSSSAMHERGRWKWRRRSILAASLLIALLGVWLIWQELRPSSDPYGPQDFRSVAKVYADEIRSGFKPLWICETDQEFAMTFWLQFRQGLLIKDIPGEIAAVGLSFCHNMTERTIYLLATADDQPVLVFVDKIENDLGLQAMTPPPDSGLNIFRSELGSLVTYELTPFDHPRVQDFFVVPEIPDQWKPGPGR